MTPPLTSVSIRPLDGVPVAMPANMLTERMPPRARSSRFSTLAAATDKITISRNVLFGLCLTTFALGIVTTLAVDHMHARATETTASREMEPVVLQTTPIEPVAKPAPAPAAPAPSSSPAVKPQVAAAGAVVVQLPSVAERSAENVAGKMVARLAPPSPLRSARMIAAAPVKAASTAPHKRTSATGPSDSSWSGTEAAPDEARATRAATQKKWVDPFDQ